MTKKEAIDHLTGLVEQVMGGGAFKKLSDLDTMREALKVLAEPDRPDTEVTL